MSPNQEVHVYQCEYFFISSFNLCGSARMGANTPSISSEVLDTPLLNAFGLD